MIFKRALLEASKQDFGEMAITFEQVINVIDHFDAYNHIEQISNLSSRVKKIKNELSVRVRKDFEANFSNPFTKFNVQNGSDLSKLVDVLDAKMKTELIKWFLKQELNEYTVLFEENQEVKIKTQNFCLIFIDFFYDF